MIIEETGLILKSSAFQESSLILKCFLANCGVVYGLYKKRPKSYDASPGNLVFARWTGRSSDNLGYYHIESLKSVFALISGSYKKILMLKSALEILNVILCERDPQQSLFAKSESFLAALCDDDINILFGRYVLFELNVLRESGFGLDLTRCCVTMQKDDLCFISPKTGRAVSRGAAGKYADRLFKMPNVFLYNNPEQSKDDITNALLITGYFLEKNLLQTSLKKHSSYRTKLCASINS